MPYYQHFLWTRISSIAPFSGHIPCIIFCVAHVFLDFAHYIKKQTHVVLLFLSWHRSADLKQVLFASSEWDNAEAICIGGNANLYGPHDYAWFDETVPYLFVSYDGGNSKAFLDCNGLSTTTSKAHLEIDGNSDDAGISAAPVVSFQQNSNALWSIDATDRFSTFSPGLSLFFPRYSISNSHFIYFRQD